ncbi:MAG: (Fe-S)-binding protein [Gammaproteobacteria bacterium]
MNEAELLAEADRCVKCGLCLPHCPTYGQTRNENESPRGRIALIQAWAGGHLETSAALLEHTDNCLLCRSCERACPAEVRFGRLMDRFREQIRERRNPSFSVSLLKTISHHPELSQSIRAGLAFYRGSGLQSAARKLKLPRLLGLAQVDRLLPESSVSTPPQGHYFPVAGPSLGEVALFHGCMGALLEPETIGSAISVLNHLGYNVHSPKQQVCCGALDRHAGAGAMARRFERMNAAAFGGRSYDAIVSLASGCGAQLKEYDVPEIAGKICDISQFIAATGVELRSRLAPLPESVCLHSPCSLRNVMREEGGALALIKQIPEIEVRQFPEKIRCCGSAGSYLLDHPDMASALLDALLAEAVGGRPRYLLSSNIGCTLHIAAGSRARGLKMEVLHPVTLIARQLAAHRQSRMQDAKPFE